MLLHKGSLTAAGGLRRAAALTRRCTGGHAVARSSSMASSGVTMLASTAAASSNGRFAGSSAAELEEWLAQHGVNTALYGQGTARTTAELFEEVTKAESVLTVDEQSSRALRLINVLNLYIVNERGQVLIEAGQRLPDGRMRQRSLPLSEKMIGAEGWQAAAVRAVSEELATALPQEWKCQLHINESSYLQLVEVQESMSYPGLLTQYTCHKVTAALPCLPQESFSTLEPRPNGTLTSYWEWKEPSPTVAAVMCSQDLK